MVVTAVSASGMIATMLDIFHCSVTGFNNGLHLIFCSPGGEKEEDVADSAESMENTEKETHEDKPVAAVNVTTIIDESEVKVSNIDAASPKVSYNASYSAEKVQ